MQTENVDREEVEFVAFVASIRLIRGTAGPGRPGQICGVLRRQVVTDALRIHTDDARGDLRPKPFAHIALVKSSPGSPAIVSIHFSHGLCVNHLNVLSARCVCALMSVVTRCD
jgi:hypothetical protein